MPISIFKPQCNNSWRKHILIEATNSRTKTQLCWENHIKTGYKNQILQGTYQKKALEFRFALTCFCMFFIWRYAKPIRRIKWEKKVLGSLSILLILVCALGHNEKVLGPIQKSSWMSAFLTLLTLEPNNSLLWGACCALEDVRQHPWPWLIRCQQYLLPPLPGCDKCVQTLPSIPCCM